MTILYLEGLLERVIGDDALNMKYVYGGPLATKRIKRLQPTS